MHESVDEHMMEGIMNNNNALAQHNREHFEEDGIFVVNLMSAPGAGKTTLLGKTIPSLTPQLACAVVEGDMVGDLDAERLRQLDIPAYQITTGRSCHLDARMIDRFLHNNQLPERLDVLFIENVGNLVCPAEFPLGEHLRVVLLSVTEGADKPLKYPIIFRNCDAVLFTKCDLLPHVDFDVRKAEQYVHGVNPEAKVFCLSTRQEDGLKAWLDWLREQVALRRKTHVRSHAR